MKLFAFDFTKTSHHSYSDVTNVNCFTGEKVSRWVFFIASIIGNMRFRAFSFTHVKILLKSLHCTGAYTVLYFQRKKPYNPTTLVHYFSTVLPFYVLSKFVQVMSALQNK